MISSLSPILPFLVGGLLLPLLPAKHRTKALLAIAALGLLVVHGLDTGSTGNATFMGVELTPVRVDGLSKVFGYIFTINAFAAFLFAYKLDDLRQHLAALFYIGASLGAVFAGDLITLYVYWEIMAVASTMLILARDTKASYNAGMRYILVHLFGGLLLLLGILLHIQNTGSAAFGPFAEHTLAAWLVLGGVLINASAVPFSSWLSDAYPESTVTGGVILSAYTTKTAVYALLRGFPGWEVLIFIGCIMVIYGIVYALLENDMRRILAYSITNQVGFMVTAAGIGTAMAINGAAAHAFCHIIYKALLWMSAGAVLAQTGRSKCTELGGLWKSMPWTMVLGTIGALAISSLPLTSGFTSKSLILQAAGDEGWVLAWTALEIASAGVFLHAGIKFPYFVFFNVDRGLRPKEAPPHMLAAMGILAFLCIFLGVYPDPLYAVLPFAMDPTFTVYKAGKIVGQMQLLMFSALVFFLFLKLLKRTDTIALEVDWLYRKGGTLLYRGADSFFNGLNAATALFVKGTVSQLDKLSKELPERLAVWFAGPLMTWNDEPREKGEKELRSAVATGTVAVGATLVAIILALALVVAFAL
jgi:multicomponent Na+:H+ antiporter subunit D